MKLTGIEITDYKSVRRSNPIETGDVTCLVGKNESGKTALLQAMYRLNPIIPEEGEFDVTDDYPRSDVEDYRQQVEADEIKPSIVVEATYTLDKEEVEEIEADLARAFSKTTRLRCRRDMRIACSSDSRPTTAWRSRR